MIEWVLRSRPRDGETANGDAATVCATNDVVWVGVIDGLGHGEEAAQAASAARAVVSRLDDTICLDEALRDVHEALKGTRGAAGTLARFDARGVELAGVGNVALRGLDGLNLPFAPVGGVLGRGTAHPRVRRAELQAGARMLFMTDGIRRRAPIADLAGGSGTMLCERLLADHSHPHDDATVLYLEYVGESAKR